MASEVITRSVGAYLNKIIDVIGLFHGDIVKFLGDAVLVVFSPRHPSETFNLVVLRATACCLAINVRYSAMELDMTLADMSAALHAGKDRTDASDFMSGAMKRQLLSGNSTAAATTLHLHFAIAAGDISRLVLGDWASRLDYAVHGDCLSSLGPILDGTKNGGIRSVTVVSYYSASGELGLTRNAADALITLLDDQPLPFLASASDSCTHTLIDANKLCVLMSAIYSTDADAMQTLTDVDISALFDNKWAVATAPAACDRRLSQTEHGLDEDLVGKFLNQSLLKKIESSWVSRSTSVTSKPVLSKRNTGLFAGCGVAASVAVEGAVQRVILCFLAALKKFEGVFQQYSVDDKGQTLLAIFGLPPFTHVNNSDQCIQSMKHFARNLREEFQEPVDLAISVATGDLLFTTIGTDFRSEAGLLGEVVIIAARLLATAVINRVLVMDELTYECVKLSNETIDLGIVKAKGRVNGVHAYGLNLIPQNDGGESAEDVYFGYERETAVIFNRFTCWRDNGAKAIVIVEAASGLGKSTLANVLISLARKVGVPTCLTQGEQVWVYMAPHICAGTEKDQWTPFYGLQYVMMFILNHYTVSSDTGSKPTFQHSGLTRSFPRDSGSLSFSSTNSIGRHAAATGNSHMVALLLKVMQSAGAEPGLAPLFSVVVPSLAMEDTSKTIALDGPARNNLLKSMLAKIIMAFVESTPAVFIFDDTQWLDSSTLDVIAQISKFCSKICLQILTRPLKDSTNKTMGGVVTLPHVDHLLLSGFTDLNCLQLIEWKLKKLTLHIQSVDPKITEAIYLKTEGNPLFVQMTLEVVVAKIGTDLVVTDTGELQLSTADSSADMILSDLSAAVLYQPGLVAFMYTATLILILNAQYFDVADMLGILSMDLSEDVALKLMRESDTYSFLLFPDSRKENAASEILAKSLLDEDMETIQQQSESVRLAFRHIGILNAIYDSLSFEERIGMNKFVAEVLEKLLSQENQDALLPSIEFHYARTGEIEKIIRYREMLGCRLVKNYNCLEGIRTLESLLQFVADVEGERQEVSPLRRAKWMAHLCAAYTVMDSYPKEKVAAFDALFLIDGTIWPQTKKEFFRMISAARRRALWLMIRTLGGRKSRSSLKLELQPETMALKAMPCDMKL
ncbi:hypothetical protein HK101_002787 [Irineochytrium annulatum]|nr:hypothetical protein HK101_002787 [Irineochytrium annulatum]